MTKSKNSPALGTAWSKTDGGHHIDSPKMEKVLKGRGGPRPGAGRKVGPSGPADARLNIKCTAADLARWKGAAKRKKRGFSEFTRSALDAASKEDRS